MARRRLNNNMPPLLVNCSFPGRLHAVDIQKFIKDAHQYQFYSLLMHNKINPFFLLK